MPLKNRKPSSPVMTMCVLLMCATPAMAMAASAVGLDLNGGGMGCGVTPGLPLGGFGTVLLALYSLFNRAKRR